jgi:hypothetical protein
LRISRVDTGAAVEISAELASVPMEASARELLPRCLSDRAEPLEVKEFRGLWQDRVRRLLLEHADDPAVIRLGPIRMQSAQS